MKKKLLVTLGCSFTEGVGCYDLSRVPPGIKYKGLPDDERKYQENRFHEYGWPNRVGKALGFDKVLNLARGGSSNSYSAKMLTERLLGNRKYDDYDIYVIWMATEPTRFSFFDGKFLNSYLPSSKSLEDSLSRAYVNSINNLYLGTLNEQVFYTKVIEQVCENNNFTLAIVHWNTSYTDLCRLYKSRYFLGVDSKPIFKRIKLDPQADISRICDHPNEAGYEKVANLIIEDIKNYRPEFVVGNTKDIIEWEWEGSNVFPEKVFQDQII